MPASVPASVPVSVTVSVVALLTFGIAGCDELPRTYDTLKRGDGGEGDVPVFTDEFERTSLGEHWRTTGDGVRLDGGTLVVEGLHNHPVWLTRPLPEAYRVEFTAWTDGDDGDIKVELSGDGVSAARSVNYVSTGYVVVFGGWNNRISVIARLDEHGKDRLEVDAPKVEPGRRYRFAITKAGGEITWSLDGAELARYEDPKPLTGPEHRYFAFGGWEAKVAFDDLRIYDLSANAATPPPEGSVPAAPAGTEARAAQAPAPERGPSR